MMLVRDERDSCFFRERFRMSAWFGKVCVGFYTVVISVQGRKRCEDCRAGKPVGRVSAPKRGKTVRSILLFLQIPVDHSFEVLGRMGARVSHDEATNGCRMEGLGVSTVLEVRIQR